MPKAYDKAKLPKPNSSNVEIADRELDSVATISFGGWATGNRVKKFQKELDSWISQQGLKKIGNLWLLNTTLLGLYLRSDIMRLWSESLDE